MRTIDLNEDWLRTLHWDLPPNLPGLLGALGVALAPGAEQQLALAAFLLRPAAKAMPAKLRAEVEGLLRYRAIAHVRSHAKSLTDADAHPLRAKALHHAHAHASRLAGLKDWSPTLHPRDESKAAALADADDDNAYDLTHVHHTSLGRRLMGTKFWDPELHPRDELGRFGELGGPALSGRPEFEHSHFEPIALLAAGKASYNASHGLATPSRDFQMVTADPVKGARIAADYAALPVNDPASHPAYDALSVEVNAQYDYLTNTLGVKVEVVPHDPYATVEEMVKDVRENGRLQVLATATTGSHPYFSDEDNDRFRAVHDAFGHAAIGRGFDRNGEEAAYQSHREMFSPLAAEAMAAGTRGQNSSLVYGDTGTFPPQKAALLPVEDLKALELKADATGLLDPGQSPKGRATAKRHEAALSAVMGRWLRRQQAVVLQRLKGPKARQHTRHWSPPGEAKLDPNRIIDESLWRTELSDDVHPLLVDLYDEAATDFLDAVGASMGVELGPIDPELPSIADAIRAREGLIGDASDTLTARIRDAIAEGEAAGEDISEISDRVLALYGDAEDWWADRVAGDEVHGGQLAAAHAAADASGLDGTKTWTTIGDERVRPTHVEADGQEVALDETFSVGGDQLRYPHDENGSPEETCNCRCLAGSVVVSDAQVRAATRRVYDGDLIEVTTLEGHKLAGTANHPVLTLTGWKPLGQVDEGDYLLCSDAPRSRTRQTAPHVDDAPPMIEEVWEALTLTRLGAKRVPGSRMDFHGDGTDGEIDIQFTDLDLASHAQASLTQGAGKGGLAAPHGTVSLARGGSALGGITEADCVRWTSAADRLIGVAEDSGDRGSAHPELSGQRQHAFALAVTSDDGTSDGGVPPLPGKPQPFGRRAHDSSLSEPSCDRPVMDADLLGYLDRTEARPVQVASHRTFRFSGHVFNLDTVAGWFMAGGIVTHNCTIMWHFDQPDTGDATDEGKAESKGYGDVIFDPEKHPRDERGRFAHSDGTEILPNVPSDELATYIEDHFTDEGEGGGSSQATWYEDPDTGDRYLLKTPSGEYEHEGTNEMVGARILDEMDLIHGDVRVAGDAGRGFDPDGNFTVVIQHLEDLPGVHVDETYHYDRAPEELQDSIRLSMFDQVTQNQDGHSGNYMNVTDADGDARIAPIDNSLILGGRGDRYGNIGFPDPAPLSEFGQYNDERQRLAQGIGEGLSDAETFALHPGPTYDETVTQLQAGVTAVGEQSFLSQLPMEQAEWVRDTAVPYMQSQVDGLRFYRDENLAWIMGTA